MTQSRDSCRSMTVITDGRRGWVCLGGDINVPNCVADNRYIYLLLDGHAADYACVPCNTADKSRRLVVHERLEAYGGCRGLQCVGAVHAPLRQGGFVDQGSETETKPGLMRGNLKMVGKLPAHLLDWHHTQRGLSISTPLRALLCCCCNRWRRCLWDRVLRSPKSHIPRLLSGRGSIPDGKLRLCRLLPSQQSQRVERHQQRRAFVQGHCHPERQPAQQDRQRQCRDRPQCKAHVLLDDHLRNIDATAAAAWNHSMMEFTPVTTRQFTDSFTWIGLFGVVLFPGKTQGLLPISGTPDQFFRKDRSKGRTCVRSATASRNGSAATPDPPSSTMSAADAAASRGAAAMATPTSAAASAGASLMPSPTCGAQSTPLPACPPAVC